MIRPLFACLLVCTPTFAQEPKPKPPAKPRIAIDDPAKLKDDQDFLLQGEYSGFSGASNKDKRPLGMHLIARGDGEFDLVHYEGGLPGDGWDGKRTEPVSVKVTKEESLTVLNLVQDGKLQPFMGLVDGKFQTLVSSVKKVDRHSPSEGKKPPDGAILLFDKPGDETKWTGGKIVGLSDGKYLGVGVKSKQMFGSFTAHVEFRLPWMPNSRGQARANSGVYLQDRYEIQVLDSFGLKGLNNECGGIYSQVEPKVNMCYPPMAWQTYDIDFTAATYDEDGKKGQPAKVNVKHNGVMIHENVDLKGPTGHGQRELAKPGPFTLQNHRDPVVYRNVWVVEKK